VAAKHDLLRVHGSDFYANYCLFFVVSSDILNKAAGECEMGHDKSNI
jgi:hypothetical protein